MALTSRLLIILSGTLLGLGACNDHNSTIVVDAAASDAKVGGDAGGAKGGTSGAGGSSGVGGQAGTGGGGSSGGGGTAGEGGAAGGSGGAGGA